MTTYRIAYIGDANSDILYQKAKEYFKARNLGDEDFQIEFEDVSQMSELEISSKNYHMVSFDISSLDNEKSKVIKALMDSKAELSDLNMLPVSRGVITEKEIQETSRKVNELSGRDEDLRVIPINISNEKDLEGYLDVLDISANEYREVAGNVLEKRDQLRKILGEKINSALAKKSTVTQEHVSSVSTMTEKFTGDFLKWPKDKAKNISFIARAHDVGKIAIPEEVLNAPHLTISNEVQQMAPHDELGGHILSSKVIATSKEMGGIVGHHGKNNGDNIYADIITIIDSFDAMTSQRAYNNPKNIVEALEQIESCSRVPNWKGEIQFKNREMAEEFIAFNAIELGKIGYDVRKMVEFSLAGKQATLEKAMSSGDEKWISSAKGSLETTQKLLEIFEKHKDQIIVDKNPQEKVTALGYSLTEEGHLDYAEKTQKPDVNIRINSEFEFKILQWTKKNSPDLLKTSKDINALIDNYLQVMNVSKEDSELFQLAQKQIRGSDSKGRELMSVGRAISEQEIVQESGTDKNKDGKSEEGNIVINLAKQIREAAQNDSRGYNTNGAKESVVQIQSLIKGRDNRNIETERGA